MKINVCDPCKKLDNKLVETNRVLRVKGRSFLNIDVCDIHGPELSKLAMPEYVRYIYKMNGTELTETDAEIRTKFL